MVALCPGQPSSVQSRNCVRSRNIEAMSIAANRACSVCARLRCYVCFGRCAGAIAAGPGLWVPAETWPALLDRVQSHGNHRGTWLPLSRQRPCVLLSADPLPCRRCRSPQPVARLSLARPCVVGVSSWQLRPARTSRSCSIGFSRGSRCCEASRLARCH